MHCVIVWVLMQCKTLDNTLQMYIAIMEYTYNIIHIYIYCVCVDSK